MKTWFKRHFTRFGDACCGQRMDYLEDAVFSLRAPLERNALLLGGLQAARVRALPDLAPLQDTEFCVFSEYGEDGIIQYLISHVPIGNESFIEFGVEDYREANTRFLLMHDNWRGLVMDVESVCIDKIKNQPLYARHDLTAQCARLTAENINETIAAAGWSGDIGLLSIDIDGNDYWVWKALTAVSPRIVVCEYNSLFGPDVALTIPYSPDFDRRKAHYSWLYFGASLSALCRLAEKRVLFLPGATWLGIMRSL